MVLVFVITIVLVITMSLRQALWSFDILRKQPQVPANRRYLPTAGTCQREAFLNTELARIFPFAGEIRTRHMKPHKSVSRTSDGCTRLKLSLQGVCERQVQGFRRFMGFIPYQPLSAPVAAVECKSANFQKLRCPVYAT